LLTDEGPFLCLVDLRRWRGNLDIAEDIHREMHRVHNLHERVPLAIRETVEFVEADEPLKRKRTIRK
jgi:hypothetical protein